MTVNTVSRGFFYRADDLRGPRVLAIRSHDRSHRVRNERVIQRDNSV